MDPFALFNFGEKQASNPGRFTIMGREKRHFDLQQ